MNLSPEPTASGVKRLVEQPGASDVCWVHHPYRHRSRRQGANHMGGDGGSAEAGFRRALLRWLNIMIFK